jgi:hypothetical protein
MDQVLVCDEKHGTCVYGTATACLRDRVREAYTYYDPETLTRAKAILATENAVRRETLANAFLDERSDYEYELVEWVPVR